MWWKLYGCLDYFAIDQLKIESVWKSGVKRNKVQFYNIGLSLEKSALSVVFAFRIADVRNIQTEWQGGEVKPCAWLLHYMWSVLLRVIHRAFAKSKMAPQIRSNLALHHLTVEGLREIQSWWTCALTFGQTLRLQYFTEWSWRELPSPVVIS